MSISIRELIDQMTIHMFAPNKENRYYNRDGEEIDYTTYAALFELEQYQRIAKHTLKPGHFVSTVWLGLDHRVDGSEKPLIFETLAYIKGEWQDAEIERYSTLEEALAGHGRQVEYWTEKLSKKKTK